MTDDFTRHIDELNGILANLRESMRQQWNRDLPVGELLSDRWARARALGFGEGASIHDSSHVYGDVRVGAHTWIGPHTILDGSGGLDVGSYCSISAGVHIYTHDTVKWALSGGRAGPEHAPVRIGDCCFIGSHSVVLKGVTIGEHSVVGAHSLADRDVPAFSVAVGTPCRIVGRVEIDADGQVALVMRSAEPEVK